MSYDLNYCPFQMQGDKIDILIIYVQLEFFTAFKEKFPKIPMMFIVFQVLKPWFVW